MPDPSLLRDSIHTAMRSHTHNNCHLITADMLADALVVLADHLSQSSPISREYASVRELAEITGYSETTIAKLALANAKRIRTLAASDSAKLRNYRHYHIQDFIDALSITPKAL